MSGSWFSKTAINGIKTRTGHAHLLYLFVLSTLLLLNGFSPGSILLANTKWILILLVSTWFTMAVGVLSLIIWMDLWGIRFFFGGVLTLEKGCAIVNPWYSCLRGGVEFFYVTTGEVSIRHTALSHWSFMTSVILHSNCFCAVVRHPAEKHGICSRFVFSYTDLACASTRVDVICWLRKYQTAFDISFDF